MSNDKKEELEEKVDLAQLYKKKGQKLRTSMEQVKEESKNKIKDRIIELEEEFPLLPKNLQQYLLSIKPKVGLPRTLFPQKYFEKPRFRGKRDYFQRLATDLLIYGLKQQRIKGHPFSSKQQIAKLFLEKHTEWNCQEKDIIHALKILLENNIVFIKNDMIYFEPLSLSKDINRILIFAEEHNIENIKLENLEKRLSWKSEKVQTTLKTMESNDLVVIDKDIVYFPFIGE